MFLISSVCHVDGDVQDEDEDEDDDNDNKENGGRESEVALLSSNRKPQLGTLEPQHDSFSETEEQEVADYSEV